MNLFVNVSDCRVRMTRPRRATGASLLLMIAISCVLGCKGNQTGDTSLRSESNSATQAHSYDVNRDITQVIVNLNNGERLEFPLPKAGLNTHHNHEHGRLEMFWTNEPKQRLLHVVWNGEELEMDLH